MRAAFDTPRRSGTERAQAQEVEGNTGSSSRTRELPKQSPEGLVLQRAMAAHPGLALGCPSRTGSTPDGRPRNQPRRGGQRRVARHLGLSELRRGWAAVPAGSRSHRAVARARRRPAKVSRLPR